MCRSNEESFASNKASVARHEVRKATIRYLNDQLRQRFTGGRVMITSGVQALDPGTFTLVIQAVCRFDDFNPDNDPHDEHDFGAVTVGEVRVFWKIDYYDKQLEGGSPTLPIPMSQRGS